ncbi:hypothetical protein M011DRAFT_478131 [Sporormia fimetaria CBS 119925]|uniref:C2H2 type master regulator of conidiophore development brlA n=1 Tax=Sporormia fimetaria CBS 119925 TaxID=1340428 RepID=A0A6A6V9F4_9PLEO|nr:hypothetical protein M011DRAFT_478131 [Sporormia fimetaria CBS 119925]
MPSYVDPTKIKATEPIEVTESKATDKKPPPTPPPADNRLPGLHTIPGVHEILRDYRPNRMQELADERRTRDTRFGVSRSVSTTALTAHRPESPRHNSYPPPMGSAHPMPYPTMGRIYEPHYGPAPPSEHELPPMTRTTTRTNSSESLGPRTPAISDGSLPQHYTLTYRSPQPSVEYNLGEYRPAEYRHDIPRPTEYPHSAGYGPAKYRPGSYPHTSTTAGPAAHFPAPQASYFTPLPVTEYPPNPVAPGPTPTPQLDSEHRPLSAARAQPRTPPPETKDPPKESDTPPDAKRLHRCPLWKEYNCHKWLTTSGHAGRHALQHTGAKNYKCTEPGCEKVFARKDNMAQHSKTHKKDSNNSRRRSSKDQPVKRTKISTSLPPISPSAPTAPPMMPHPGQRALPEFSSLTLNFRGEHNQTTAPRRPLLTQNPAYGQPATQFNAVDWQQGAQRQQPHSPPTDPRLDPRLAEPTHPASNPSVSEGGLPTPDSSRRPSGSSGLEVLADAAAHVQGQRRESHADGDVEMQQDG